MRTMTGKWFAAAIAAAVLMTSAVPSQAFMPAPLRVERQSDATEVQYHRPGYERRGGYYYYNGYRGYNYRRPGYRYYNGWWYPMAAFGAGVIIGGAVAQPPRYTRPACACLWQPPCAMVLRPLPLLPGLRQHLPALRRGAPAVLLAQ